MKRFGVILALAIAQITLAQDQLSDSRSAAPFTHDQEPNLDESMEYETRSVALDVMEVGTDFLDSRPQNATRYPIVMIHGFLGWDQVFFLDYFYHIRKALESEGFTIYTPRINPVNSVEVRAHELAPLVDQILEHSQADKINIIAHSMGGLDARYLVGTGYADKIASITTIGTPHHGTPVPDLVFKFLGKNDNILYKTFEYIVAGLLGKNEFPANSLDLRACLWNLSRDFMEDYFNVRFQDHPDIYMQSYAGVSSITGWKTGDRLDYLLLPFQPAFGWGERNDGLVPLPSAQWGRFRGIVSADHVNLIGQLFGRTSARFDHVKFYKKIVYDLVDLGF